MQLIEKPLHGSVEWLRLRHRTPDGGPRFSASEAGVLMGVSPYETRAALVARKMLPDPVITETTPVMERGNVLEPALITWAAGVAGVEISTPDVMFGTDDHRWVATLDGTPVYGAVDFHVEAKTTRKYRFDRAELHLPPVWEWQGIAQMLCADTERVLWVILDRDMELHSYWQHRDQKLIDGLLDEADMLADVIAANDGIPDWLEPSADDITVLSPTEVPELTVELGEGAQRWVEKLAAARVAKRQAEADEKEARNHVARIMRDAGIGVVDGDPIITWKAYPSTLQFDVARFRLDHKQLADEYMKPRAGARVMRLVK